MNEENKQNKDQYDDISILDNLIKLLYDRFKEEFNTDENKNIKEKKKEKVKLGDLLKMIELRRKFTPADNDQKKFWEYISQIRKEELDKPSKKKVAKGSSRKKNEV